MAAAILLKIAQFSGSLFRFCRSRTNLFATKLRDCRTIYRELRPYGAKKGDFYDDNCGANYDVNSSGHIQVTKSELVPA
jgi:hypothetical protein